MSFWIVFTFQNFLEILKNERHITNFGYENANFFAFSRRIGSDIFNLGNIQNRLYS